MAFGKVNTNFGQVYGMFGPTSHFFTNGSVTASDIYSLWSGTCNATTFLRGDGSCQVISGGGNVSVTGTPTAGQMAEWTNATTVEGVSTIPSGVMTSSLVVPSDYTTSISLGALFASRGTICDFAGNGNTCADTVYSNGNITVAASSTSVTMPSAVAASYQGANIVISGAGPAGCGLLTVANGGSGYVVGDIVTVSGGTETTACGVTVEAITGTNGVSNYAVSTAGSYTAKPANPVTFTGGGCSTEPTADLIWTSVSPYTVSSAVPVTSGAGCTNGGTLTLSGGTQTTQATFTIVASTGGVMVAVPTTEGSYSAVPGNPVSTTGGTGTGATFNLTWYGAPLATTITSATGTTSITINTAATTALSATDVWYAYGHDDRGTINTAQAHGITRFDTGKTFGIYTNTEVDNSQAYDFDCQGDTIVMLAPSSNGMLFVGGAFWGSVGSVIENCHFEGMGIANEIINFEGAYVQMHDVELKNPQTNASGGTYTGLTGNVTTSLYLSGSGVLGNQFDHIKILNSCPSANGYNPAQPILAVCPATLITVGPGSADTDNQFKNILGAGATLAGVWEENFGTFYTDMHLYNVDAGPNIYSTGGQMKITTIYADGGGFPGVTALGNQGAPPNIPMIYVSFNNTQIVNFYCTVSTGTWNGQDCIDLTNHPNIVGMGNCQNWPAGSPNCVASSSNTNIVSQDILNSSYSKGPPYTIATLPSCTSDMYGQVRTTVTNGVATPTYFGAVSTTGSAMDSVLCTSAGWVYD